MNFIIKKPETLKQIDPPSVSAVVTNMVIPPCPAILTELRSEIGGEDPDIHKIARLITSDVALSVAVLSTINSPYYGLSRRVESITQAASMIGLRPLSTLVSGILLRQSEGFKGLNLVRFWDVSRKRSAAMLKLARGLKGVEPDAAYSFGLFCDIGIPLLMQRFPGYGETLKLANDVKDQPFTCVEFDRHGVDHARIGAMMAKSWGLNESLCAAIRRHHDYSIFLDNKADPTVVSLIAMSLVAELAIQRYARLNRSNEWEKGGEFAAGALMLSDQDIDDWVENIAQSFDSDSE